MYVICNIKCINHLCFLPRKLHLNNTLTTTFYIKCLFLGTSTTNGRFFALAAAVASNEDSVAWSSIYGYVRHLKNSPKVHLADEATAITKAIDNVFGLENCVRNMCWPHVYRNLVPQLKCVSTFNKDVGKKILEDVEFLQWSVMNEQSFLKVYELLEQKYVGKYDDGINEAIGKFFSYMRSVWIESKQHRWFEAAHPWQPSNNQGVEGKNKDIKQSHTFRRRLDIGELFNVLLNMVKEWSEEDDKLLESGRIAALHGEKDSLRLKTEGYQWYKENQSKADRILRINPGEKYSVNDSVTNFWAVASSSATSDKSLKDRAKERMKNRKLPEVDSFDEYAAMRSSCWILEEVDGEFYCDCPIGMKVDFLKSI